jgi:hypothetical protein
LQSSLAPLFKSIYSPTSAQEENLHEKLKSSITSSLENMTELKKKQATRILNNVETSPQRYIETFSPIHLVLGTPGGGLSYRKNKLILHPSWANHPSSVLLAIHEFEHILYFTDTYLPYDHFIKMAYHYLLHPKSFKKRIEERAIRKTKNFVDANINLTYFKNMQTSLKIMQQRETLDTLEKHNVIDKMERVNLTNIFKMPDQVVVNAYKRWELVNYNKRYIEMLKSAMQKKPERYLKDELKKYRLSKNELIREYGLKLVTWSTIMATILRLCSVI